MIDMKVTYIVWFEWMGCGTIEKRLCSSCSLFWFHFANKAPKASHQPRTAKNDLFSRQNVLLSDPKDDERRDKRRRSIIMYLRN